jgi:hypothetical protein
VRLESVVFRGHDYAGDRSVRTRDAGLVRRSNTSPVPGRLSLRLPAEILLTEVPLISRRREIAIHALTTLRHLAYGETFQTLINLQPFLLCTTTPPMSQPTRHVRAIDTGTSIGPQTSPAIIDSSQICLDSIRWIKK